MPSFLSQVFLLFEMVNGRRGIGSTCALGTPSPHVTAGGVCRDAFAQNNAGGEIQRVNSGESHNLTG